MGFLPDWLENVSAGDPTKDEYVYLYEKLNDKLKFKVNHQQKEIDIFVSTAYSSDLKSILNYLLPKDIRSG